MKKVFLTLALVISSFGISQTTLISKKAQLSDINDGKEVVSDWEEVNAVFTLSKDWDKIIMKWDAETTTYTSGRWYEGKDRDGTVVYWTWAMLKNEQQFKFYIKKDASEVWIANGDKLFIFKITMVK